MIGKVIIENGQKKIQALTADTGVGAPVGSYLYLEKKSNPQGYLYCDGSTFDETVYPALYQYLGTNVLPDWREFSPVGAEQNTTNVYDAQTNPNGVIHTHDVFTQGQAKDDQLQSHSHYLESQGVIAKSYSNSGASFGYTLQASNATSAVILANSINSGRVGDVTRGKSKAAFIYIKATSGLTENQQENVLNTINENNSYSTEETVTGAKWIDGKPIYRKVVNIGNASISTNNSYDHNIANLGTVISLTRHFMYNNNHYMFWDDNMTWTVTSSKINISGSTSLNVSQLFFIIEYTKTTD